MTNKKLLSLITGVAILCMSILPSRVHALNTATMTLSGTTNNTGYFTTTIYANTGSDTATTAYVRLDFNKTVLDVKYNYNVGPFSNPLPSGAYSTKGEVSGSQPVATVSFRLSNPDTVTASISGSSYLKHAVKDSNGYAIGTENFTISRGSASFTYSAPATQTQPDNNVPQETTKQAVKVEAKSPTNNNTRTNHQTQAGLNTPMTTNEEVQAESISNNTTDQQPQTVQGKDSKKSTTKASVWLLVAMTIVIAGITYIIRGRNKSSTSTK